MITHSRAGVSLIEVLIALSLFSLVMAFTLECMTGMRTFAGGEVGRNDLTLESQKIISTIVSDIGNSAWIIDPAANTTDLDNPALDRSMRYYPFVMVQAPTGVPTTTRLQDWARSAAYVPNWTNSPYIGTIPTEHMAQSQELVFLKVQRAPPAQHPPLSSDHVNYSTDWLGNKLTAAQVWTAGVLPMTNFQTGVKVDSIVTDVQQPQSAVASDLVQDTPLVMETYPSSTALVGDDNFPTSGPAFPPHRTNPDFLREYAYVVVPDAATGKNELVRCWRNGTTYMPVYPPNAPNDNAGYDVISEYVDRLVIDTYRTLSTLDINQVRIRVYMSKDSVDAGTSPVVTMTSECTTALRSTVDPFYSLNLGSWLGPSGTMHTYLNTDQAGGVH